MLSQRSGAVNRKSLYLERGDVWAELLSSFAFDTAGRVHWYQLPSTEPPNANGVDDQYAYSLDALGQPLALSRMEYENGWYQRTVSVASATYGPDGQINTMTYGGYTETRTHNAWGQMTRMTGSGGGMPSIDLEYYFSATANNGRITGMRDHATGEQVSYSYDGWNRLSAATSTGGAAWGLSFTYDGFGNRTGQAVTSGSAPTSSLVIDGQKNRIVGTGYQYDLNGNLIAMPGMPAMSYDVENRLQTVGTDTYVYGPNNERLCKNSCETIEVYSPGGQRMGTYRVAAWGWEGTPFQLALVNENIYMAGRLIQTGTPAARKSVVVDRLGSVVGTSAGERLQYFPYGEERPAATTNDRDKFATYYRDAGTGLDYAMNRYYGNMMGRFLTADPTRTGRRLAFPQVWNLYAYVHSDPVNMVDPRGLEGEAPPPGFCNNNPLHPLCRPSIPDPQGPTLPDPWDDPWGWNRRGTSEATSQDLAELMAWRVKHKLRSDCGALADFAGLLLGQAQPDIWGYFASFRWFTPYDPALPEGVRSVNNPSTLVPASGTNSGFLSQYREGSSDQVHHFAVYFQWGAQLGELFKESLPVGVLTATLGSLVGEAIQVFTGGSVNAADYRLGRDAAILGASIAAGVWKHYEVSYRIYTSFCDQTWRAPN